MTGFITRTLYPDSLVMVLGISLMLTSLLMQISQEANVSTPVTREETTVSEEAYLHQRNAAYADTSPDIQEKMSIRADESLYSQTKLESVLSLVWNICADRIKTHTASYLLRTEVKQNWSRPYEHFLKWAQQIANHEWMGPLEERTLLHVLAKTNATDAVRSLLLIGAAASEQDSKKDTPLHYAVRVRAHAIMRLLLKAGADRSIKGSDNLTPLDAAVESGDNEAVRILFHEGSSHLAIDVIGDTIWHVVTSHNHNALKTLIDGIGVLPKPILNFALEEAIKKEDREAIQLLMAAQVEDISIDKAEDYPQSKTTAYPMSEATARGREDILNIILDAWGYVNERNERRGENPLMTAAWNNNPGSIRMLVSAGASLENGDNYKETALFYASRSGSDALTALLDLGANVNATNDRGRNALHNAVLWNNAAAVKVLLKAGIDKEARDLEGKTPVFSGAGQSTDALHLLLKSNVSLNIRDFHNLTPFLHLISIGDEQGTILLLDWSPDLEEQDDDGNNALLLAAKQASERRSFYSNFGLGEPLTIVKKLVEAGADVDAQNDDGISPLLWFVDTNFIPAAEYMLSVGADKDIRDARGYTPLHLMAEKGYTPTLRMLLRSGVDVNARDRQGRTPIIVAAASDKANAVHYLVEAKAAVNAQDDSGRTALHWAAKSGVDTVNILLQNGANVSTTDMWGKTPLHWAVQREDILEVLLNAGSDRNAQDVDGSTPLLLAMNADCEGCVRKLLQDEVDVNIRDKKGVTPVMYGVEHNHMKYLEMFFQAGGDLDARDNEGSTALHRATVNGSINALRCLLEMGVTVDAKDNNGKTPLHLASERNNLKALEALLAAGADVNLPDGSGRTALHWAAGKGGERVVERLIRTGADVNAEDKEGKTPLWDAVYSDDATSAALLLSAGADVNHEVQGRTPLDLARQRTDVADWKKVLRETKTSHIEAAKGNVR